MLKHAFTFFPDKMQKICSESLNDCEAKTRRRQVNKLRHIKKILEDLQKQIRNLKAVSNEELSRSMPRTSSSSEPTPSTSRGTTAASTSESRPSTSSMMEDTDEDDLDANNQSRSKLQVAKYNKLKFAIKRLSSDQPRRPPQPDQSLHRTSNRLSRVHSQLVSQMRATYRAMERKNQFQRSSSPLSSSSRASPLTTSWQKIVAEETSLTRPLPLHERSKDANSSDTSSASGLRPEDTKKELRALSQRLEKLLREKREKVIENSSLASSSTLPSASSSNAAATDLDASTSAASSQVNSSAIEIDDMIPRPDPLPVDPR